MNTYNADRQWYWATTSGPMPALKHLSKASNARLLLQQIDHADRQKLEDGSWEYTWHPYTNLNSFEGTEFESEVEELKSCGWVAALTGSETSEYAQEHKATECSTRRVSLVRLPLEDRVALAEELNAEIESLKSQIKANKMARKWDTYLDDEQALVNLKHKKQILLYRR